MLRAEDASNLKAGQKINNKKSLELRRKIIHIVFGSLLSFLIYFDLFFLPFWIGFLISVIIVSLLLKEYKPRSKFALKIWKPFSNFILYFEREDEKIYLPLRGVITFILGCLLSYLLFAEKSIVVSTIFTLFIGDSTVALYGVFFGKLKYPWSPRKHVDASLVGIILNSIFISIFFPLPKALFASIFTFFFESFDIRFNSIPFDDNIFLPLLTGLVLTLI